jgi:hypothetical protein
MEPQTLFPVLSLLFAGLAVASRWRRGRWAPGASAWLWLSVIFAIVAVCG